MPHLQFECSAAMTDAEKRAFAERVTALYAEHMDTGTDHVAVTIRERASAELALGRADPDEPCLILDADVRRGRSFEGKRSFALAVMEPMSGTYPIRT